MKKKLKIVSFADAVSVTDDPVERHILEYLDRLKQQNKRLKAHVDKTASWTHLKTVESWKPFDFYRYFCNKYQEKYRKEFRLKGNIVKAYDRIEGFLTSNSIANEDYKEFIDLAFSRYFNVAIVPILGNICSPSLYERLMGRITKPMSTDDLFSLDQVIAKESRSFEKSIKENGNGGVITYGSQKCRNAKVRDIKGKM